MSPAAAMLTRSNAAPVLVPRRTAPRVEVRLAATLAEREAALTLRHRVFHLEQGRGGPFAAALTRDEDDFDAACDHLIALDTVTGDVVGTYRLQDREMARRSGLGFYSEGEFDLSRLPDDVLGAAVEIGRACVAPSHRGGRALFSLWRGLGAELQRRGKRYLFGCSSLPTLNPADGLWTYTDLILAGRLHPELRVVPRKGLGCPELTPAPDMTPGFTLPLLLSAYLRHGAVICGPPAMDRAFGTIDFFTLIDTHAMPPGSAQLFLEGGAA